MICDIVSHERDLGHCVKAEMNVYTIEDLCVDVEGQVCIVLYCCAIGCLGWLLECIP